MSISTEPRTAPDRARSGKRAAAGAELRPATRLYRVIWRWHFYAGVLVAPVLVVMAATGALYIFRDELEALFYAKQMFVVPAETRTPYDSQVAAAQAALPRGFEVNQVIVSPDPRAATEMYASNGTEFRRAFVDPYRGASLGTLGPNDFFRMVLKIHRTLFAGTLGRIVTELVTCWTIVLLASGAYLWWPRGRGKLWGALVPRLRRHPYVALRDLHAVSGAYVAIVALLIAATGLLYTYVWGQGYRLAATRSGAYDIFLNPPQSRSPADAPRLPLDDIVAASAQAMPDATLGVRLPREASGAYVVFATRPRGPSSDGYTVIDHATAEVLSQRTNREYPALAWWSNWNYPLHVGSVLGQWTKIPWLLACVVLMLLPITGIWMWWQRRPRGRTGLPRKPQVRIPRTLVVGICLLSALLPALGLSIMAILLGETAFARLRT